MLGLELRFGNLFGKETPMAIDMYVYSLMPSLDGTHLCCSGVNSAPYLKKLSKKDINELKVTIESCFEILVKNLTKRITNANQDKK